MAMASIGWRIYIMLKCLTFCVDNLPFVSQGCRVQPGVVHLVFMDCRTSPIKQVDELWELIREGRDMVLTNEIGGREHDLQVTHVEIAYRRGKLRSTIDVSEISRNRVRLVIGDICFAFIRDRLNNM